MRKEFFDYDTLANPQVANGTRRYNVAQTKLKKLMKIFFSLFLISLVITIGLFHAATNQPINQETVTASVVSHEPCTSFFHNVRGNRHDRQRYHITVRYHGRENTWCYINEPRHECPIGRSGGTVQAYISPDGSLAMNERMSRAYSTTGKLYRAFLAVTAASFISFIIVYDKIWRIKHTKQEKETISK